jgi:hypothetical protein
VPDASAGSDDVFNTVIEIVAAVIATVAAIAAWRQAVAARRSAEFARDAERRNVLGQVLVAAREVIAEGKRIDALVAETKQTHKSYCSVARGGGGYAGLEKQLDEKIQRIQPALQHAAKYLGPDQMQTASSHDDMTVAAATLRGHVVELAGVRAEIERELADVSTQLNAYRDAMLNRTVDRSSGVNPQKRS